MQSRLFTSIYPNARVQPGSRRDHSPLERSEVTACPRSWDDHVIGSILRFSDDGRGGRSERMVASRAAAQKSIHRLRVQSRNRAA